jgi:hypothetical protein
MSYPLGELKEPSAATARLDRHRDVPTVSAHLVFTLGAP